MVSSACVVIIVDDHHHILPEIHLVPPFYSLYELGCYSLYECSKAIRQHRLSFDKLGFVHIDAHPDLSFIRDKDPSRIIYRPDELYEALDSSISGIAEFIWPLIYAGHVSRFLWIQSPWSNQMDQMTEFHVAVGRHSQTERLGVTSVQKHLQDEKLFARESELMPKTIKYVDLHVRKATAFERLPRIQEVDMLFNLTTAMSETECCTREALRQVIDSSENGYILDIDLDYFSTWNPFYSELVKVCGVNSTRMLYSIFHENIKYKEHDKEVAPESRMEGQVRFELAMKAVEEACTLPPGKKHTGYSKEILYGKVQALNPFYCEESEELLESFYRFLLRGDQKTRDMVWNGGPSLDQPHYEASILEIDYLIRDLKKVFTEASLARPQLITIAKSTQDEFLPPHQLNYVLNGVLEMLRDMFGLLTIREIDTD